MAKAETAVKADEEQAVPYDPWTDMVQVKLFKDNDRYSDDVFVGINGRTYLIKRGVEATVPRCVKEVLDNAEAQSRAAEEFQNSLGSLN